MYFFNCFPLVFITYNLLSNLYIFETSALLIGPSLRLALGLNKAADETMYTLFESIPLVCKNFLLLYNCTSFIKSVTPWSSTIDCGIPFTSSGFAKSPPFNSPILAVASFIAASWKGLSFSVNSGSPCTPLRLIRSAFLSRTFVPLSSFSTVKLNLETYFALLAGSLIIAFPLNSDLTVS